MKKVRPFLDKGIQLRASVKCTVHVFPNIWLWTDGLYFTIIPPPTGKSPESFAYHNSYLTVTMARIIMQPHSPLKSLPPASPLHPILSFPHLSLFLSLTHILPPSLPLYHTEACPLHACCTWVSLTCPHLVFLVSSSPPCPHFHSLTSLHCTGSRGANPVSTCMDHSSGDGERGEIRIKFAPLIQISHVQAKIWLPDYKKLKINI